MSRALASIVEGQGDQLSLPGLLTAILRTLADRGIQHGIHVVRPIRQHRQKLVRPGELERAIKLALRTKNVGAILVLLDADDDCPAVLGPALLERAIQATHLPVRVVLAKREFEAWFLGCMESFRGFMGIPHDAMPPENPENLGGKGTLQGTMAGNKYLSAQHQAEFVRKMDLGLCRARCPSFDKFHRDVEHLAQALAKK